MEILPLQQLHLQLQTSQIFVIILRVQPVLPRTPLQCTSNFSFKPEEQSSLWKTVSGIALRMYSTLLTRDARRDEGLPSRPVVKSSM